MAKVFATFSQKANIGLTREEFLNFEKNLKEWAKDINSLQKTKCKWPLNVREYA